MASVVRRKRRDGAVGYKVQWHAGGTRDGAWQSETFDDLRAAAKFQAQDGHLDADGRLDGLIHHSDAGSQYLALRYSERLADAGAVASIGTVGDSYDNAQAESLIGLYKVECVRPEGPGRGVDDLELATLNWVHWFNHERLHSALGHQPSVETEQGYYRQIGLPQQPLPGELTRH